MQKGGAGFEEAWADLANPLELVDRFAKLEHDSFEEGEGGSALQDLYALGRGLDWPTNAMGLSELEELFDTPTEPAAVPQPSLQSTYESSHSHRPNELYADVRVELLHRTRVAHGCEWQVVKPKEEIRVTRNRGKLFKVLVESSMPFNGKDVHLFLADSASSPIAHTSPRSSLSDSSSSEACASSPLRVTEHDLVVLSVDDVHVNKDGHHTKYSIEMKVKLCLIAKGIQIGARITPSTANLAYVGRSVEFMTHNNGKQKVRANKPKKKSDANRADGSKQNAKRNNQVHQQAMIVEDEEDRSQDLSIPIKQEPINRLERLVHENPLAPGSELSSDGHRDSFSEPSQSAAADSSLAALELSIDATNTLVNPHVQASRVAGAGHMATHHAGFGGRRSSYLPDKGSGETSSDTSPIGANGAFIDTLGQSWHNSLPAEPVLEQRHDRKRKADGNFLPREQKPPIPDKLSIRGDLHVEGIVRAQGYMQYSDMRLKTNVEDIVDAVNLISKLNGKRYRWKEKEEVERLAGKAPIGLRNNGGMKVIGLIAQQVQQVLPEVVREDEDGFLSVDYAEIIPVLIEAFNQHLDQYHKQQKDLKEEFDSWRRHLGGPESSSNLKEVIVVKQPRPAARMDPNHRLSADLTDSELDSLDQSSGTLTDEEADEFHDEDQTGLNEEPSSMLLVDLDQLVSNKRNLAQLAAQMNKLIPDRQYIDLLQYVKDQKKKERKQNTRIFFLFIFACLTLFVINVAIAVGVPFGVTFLIESHL